MQRPTAYLRIVLSAAFLALLLIVSRELVKLGTALEEGMYLVLEIQKKLLRAGSVSDSPKIPLDPALNNIIRRDIDADLSE